MTVVPHVHAVTSSSSQPALTFLRLNHPREWLAVGCLQSRDVRWDIGPALERLYFRGGISLVTFFSGKE